MRGDTSEITPQGDACRASPRTSLGGGTTLPVDRLGGTEVCVKDLSVTNELSLRQHGEVALREPGRLNIEFLVGFEMIGEPA